MPIKSGQEPLSIRELRGIERHLGVYISTPKHTKRCPNQQFGIYDEAEQWSGDVVAKGRYFTLVELEAAINVLFEAVGASTRG